MRVDEKIEELKDHCRENGIPLTQQRIATYRVLVDSDEHPSPEMIYRCLKINYPTLSLATVYKNLEALARMGFAKKINPLSDHARYDGDLEPHNHFVCLSCKKVEDIHSDANSDLRIPDLKDTEHVITGKTVQYFGICKACKDDTQKGK